MKKIGEILVVTILFFIWASSALAAKVSAQATVDRNSVTVGESFTLTITVRSENSLTLDEPRLPDLTGFDLSNSWAGSESRSTFTNGVFQVEQSRTFNYQLAANKTGRLQIGPATVVVEGQSLKTQPIVITVQPAQQGLAGSSPRGQRPPSAPSTGDGDEDPFRDMEDMFNQLLQRRGLQGPQGQGNLPQAVNPNEAFFIDAQVDKRSAYAGEQIKADWYLYTRGVIRDIDTLKYPSLTGFWKEEIELATRLNFESQVVNGLPYKRALLASYALFPIKEGTVTIDPYQAKCTVLTGDVFGFGRPYQFTKASKPIKIEVKALPTDGRPKYFSGAVGEFAMTASLDSASVHVNQPVTLKIRLAGFGNAKLIDLPPLDVPAGLELYDTKKDAKFFRDGKSYREFEVLLIPRQVGNMTIPPVSVSVFNPRTGRYETQTSPSLKLEVLPGGGGESVSGVPLKDSTSEQMQAREPAVPDPIGDANMRDTGWTFPGWIWFFVYLAGLLILVWRWSVELGFGKGKEALKSRLQKRMKKLDDLARKSDYRALGVSSTNLIYMILGELAGHGGASRELEVLLNEGPPSLRRELGEKLKSVLAQSESLAFAPEAMIGDLKNKEHLVRFLRDLEKTLTAAVALDETSGRKED